MKKSYLTLLFLTVFAVSNAQTNYYISVEGNNNNSGLNKTNTWATLTYALSSLSPVLAGDTIFIKSGSYTENVIIQKNGTLNKPIVIQGYQTVPYDNPNLNYAYGDSLDASIMPLFNGMNRTSGTAIDINGATYIVIKNLQITKYENGIMDSSQTNTNITLNNIIVKDMGDISAFYSGRGIKLNSSGNIVTNCIVINSSAEGFLIFGDNNLLENCKVYCDDNRSANAAMDYYIVIYYGNNNIVKNCYIERVGNLPHIGHGIGVKGDCENNLFENCIAKNLAGGGFYVRHRGAKYNTFNNCTAIESTGILIRDGASYNTFNNIILKDNDASVRFLDTSEDDGAQYCGRNNTFNNCIITNANVAIDFNDYDQDTDVDHNSFYNCVFYNGKTLINAERNNYKNRMLNCIVMDYQHLSSGPNNISFNFLYSVFYNNNFTLPKGKANITDNPGFTDVSTNNFHLQSTSICIDAGTSLNAPDFDFEGNVRPQGTGIDIGIYEYVKDSLHIINKK